MELVRIVCHGNSLAVVRDEPDAGAVLRLTRLWRNLRAQDPAWREEVRARRAAGDPNPLWWWGPDPDDEASWSENTRRQAQEGGHVFLEGPEGWRGGYVLQCPTCGKRTVELQRVYEDALEARQTGRKTVFMIPA